MTVLLLYALLKLASLQHFEDGSGVMPLYQYDTAGERGVYAEMRIVYCLPDQPCTILATGETEEPGITVSAMPVFPRSDPYKYIAE